MANSRMERRQHIAMGALGGSSVQIVDVATPSSAREKHMLQEIARGAAAIEQDHLAAIEVGELDAIDTFHVKTPIFTEEEQGLARAIVLVQRITAEVDKRNELCIAKRPDNLTAPR